jgi:hypothetical protein
LHEWYASVLSIMVALGKEYCSELMGMLYHGFS